MQDQSMRSRPKLFLEDPEFESFPFIELHSQNRELGRMYFTLYSNLQPDICAHFKSILKPIQQKRIFSNLSGQPVQPNIQNCFFQFGLFSILTENVNILPQNVKPKAKQLLWITGTNEFAVTYNGIEHQNCVVIGEVNEESSEVYEQMRMIASIDGKGTEDVVIVGSQ
ncbi:Cyclophilin-like_domain superfamily [Hexamita inflata]|uniref:Cyclophilin-like domain superfamily n=1 Tax=Hexamita inflata TaxID=28002 RepID=A0AA86QVI7_9EUKA|nr:Cyclophilin-like domain superfamily [Hexamita inflata]